LITTETSGYAHEIVRVLIRRSGEGKFSAPQVSAYGNEAQLQALIAETPELLPGVDGGPPVVVMREFPLPVGRVDVVVVDLEGGISLCECKLRTNPQARREVIGQLVSYAGALSRMSYDDFAQRASAKLGRLLPEALAAVAEGEFESDAFHQAVASNLAAGRFRLVIVIDEISEELRDAVLYLNDQTQTEFFALELGYLSDNGLEILVPAAYGQEAVERKSRLRRSKVEGADTVIVAAKRAYTEYRRRNAYICQPASSPRPQKTRTFRPSLRRLGFYRNKQIEPEIPQIVKHYPSVPFTAEEAEKRKAGVNPNESRLGEIIAEDLADAEARRRAGEYWQVFLLTAPEDSATLRLPQPIAHRAQSAWTQHQRYTLESALETMPASTEELAVAEETTASSD
jgi:hypothetical protein